MHINRLRLLGFKSFVEPTELVIEQGLTGVVGPNGCGKSNLLEALRWVMGETSHKSMRAAAMDDVIFSGTAIRPPRNTAEVTIFIDNSGRQAPTEFNGNDTLEVTRRIEREAGSAYRINGREVRARDVRILFEDAATGARSPALVRQGQIGELVNAKPEQRRRILEDAAGIAGLHSRRHEAELRLRAADGNLARLNDILGQLNSQIESLKRQARAGAALQGDLGRDPQARGDRAAPAVGGGAGPGRRRGGQSRRGAGEGRARHRGRGQGAQGREPRPPRQLQPLRDQEAAKGAILARFRIEQENLEREAQRTADRQQRVRGPRRAARPRHGARAVADRRGQGDAWSASRPRRCRSPTPRGSPATSSRRRSPPTTRPKPRSTAAEARLSELTTATAEARARRQSLETQRRERHEQIAKLERQLDRARRPDPRDRRPRARRLQAQGRRRARPAADGRDRQHRGRDAGGRGSRAGRGRRRQGQERGGRRGRACRRPAQDRGRDAGQAAHARRRQRPAAGARPHQGRGGLRDGAGRGAGRRPRRAGRGRSARALAAQRRSAKPTRPCRPASSRSSRTWKARPS